MIRRAALAFALSTAFALASPAAALPPAPSAAVERLIGQYGPADNALSIYESEGRLFADGHGLKTVRLRRAKHGRYHAGMTVVAFTGQNSDTVVVLNRKERLARHDFGAETVATIQAKVKADPAKVRAEALAATPPVETGKKPADLVALTTLDPRINSTSATPLRTTSWAFRSTSDLAPTCSAPPRRRWAGPRLRWRPRATAC